MIRVRFCIKFEDCDDDYRPVKWPIKHPYWCTGQSADSFTLVAYADNEAQVKELWPEAYDIESNKVDKVEFTSRFPRPEWY